MMKIIALTKGRYACVDDDVHEMLSQWNWQFSGGYATSSVGLMHRVVAAVFDLDISQVVDHINTCGTDNRRSNLRAASRSQNMHNSKSAGIDWSKKDRIWRARLQHNGMTQNLGVFPTKEEAASARRDAETAMFGDFIYDPSLRCPLYGFCPECDSRVIPSKSQRQMVAECLPARILVSTRRTHA